MSLTVSGVVTDATGQTTTDGSIVITVSGGTSPYTYAWTNGSTSKDLSSVASGQYCVTVTDSAAATATYTGTVNASLKIHYKFSNSSSITDDSSPTGATLSGSGGSPYSDSSRGMVASFAGGSTDRYSTSSVSGFDQGTSHSVSFWIKVTTWPTAIASPFQLGDGVSNRWMVLLDTSTQWRLTCVSSSTSINVIVPSRFSTGVWHHIVASYNSATGVHTVYLDGTSVQTGTQSMPSQACNILYIANSFNNSQPFTGYLSNFCLFSSLLGETDIASLNSETISPTASVSDGALTLSVTGGIAPVLYLWNTGAITQNLESVTTGDTYDVTITDALGITATLSKTVESALSVSYTQTNVSIYGGSDGNITVTPSGGTGTYTYVWSDGSVTTSTRSLLAAGTYTVTVSSGSYTESQTVNITQPISISYTQTNVSVYGGSDGAITVTPYGGTGTYTYAWSDGSATTSTRSSLSTATYTVTVSSGSYTKSQAVTITQRISVGIPIAEYACTETSGSSTADSANSNTATHNGSSSALGLYLGSDAYLDLPFNLSGRTSITVSLFVKLDASSDCTVFSTDDSSTNSLELMISASGILSATHASSSGQYSLSSKAVVQAGTYSHCAYTYNYTTTTQALFINGSSVRYEASVPQLTYNDTNVVIGGKASKDSSKFIGFVKSIYIGASALAPGSVEALYKESSDALLLPFGSVEGQKISSAGDFVMRSAVTSSLYHVGLNVPGNETNVAHRTFALDSGTTSHFTSVETSMDALNTEGRVDISVRDASSMVTPMSIESGQTVIASASAGASSIATVDTTGLSFDSDDCAVYFGASKEFRIRFEPTGIARLAFEYYDSLTDSYVMGASFLK